jgi:hypothetical protein
LRWERSMPRNRRRLRMPTMCGVTSISNTRPVASEGAKHVLYQPISRPASHAGVLNRLWAQHSHTAKPLYTHLSRVLVLQYTDCDNTATSQKARPLLLVARLLHWAIAVGHNCSSTSLRGASSRPCKAGMTAVAAAAAADCAMRGGVAHYFTLRYIADAQRYSVRSRRSPP